METSQEILNRLTLTIENWPKEGVIFKDLTPVFEDPTGLDSIITELYNFDFGNIDLVAGAEARGFILAGAMAQKFNKGVLLIRKKGKLPPPIISESYDLEYGSATLEIADKDLTGKRILVVDDVLATGGTLGATAKLIERAGGEIAGIATIMELSFLSGRSRLIKYNVHTIQAI